MRHQRALTNARSDESLRCDRSIGEADISTWSGRLRCAIDFELGHHCIDTVALQTLYSYTVSNANETPYSIPRSEKEALYTEVINEALILLITVHGLPFRLVKSDKFRILWSFESLSYY